MKQITVEDLQNSVYFKVDYRSPPDGIGHINYPNKDSILITELDNCITCIDDAKKYIEPENVPTDVIQIRISLEDDEGWEKFKISLNDILRKNNVLYVYDAELYYEELYNGFDDFELKSVGEHIFKLEDWINIRS